MAEEINKDNPDKSTGGWCGLCGKAMRPNVPRLGWEAGGVHADTGQFDCGPRKELQMNSVDTDAYDKLPAYKKMDMGQLQLKWRTKKILDPEPGELNDAVIEALSQGGLIKFSSHAVSCVTEIIENVLRQRDELQRKFDKAMWTLKFADKNPTLQVTQDSIKDTIEFLEDKKS